MPYVVELKNAIIPLFLVSFWFDRSYSRLLIRDKRIILGNTYSDHLREIISACIQTDSIKRPDISQIRLKCEQILHVIQQQALTQQQNS